VKESWLVEEGLKMKTRRETSVAGSSLALAKTCSAVAGRKASDWPPEGHMRRVP